MWNNMTSIFVCYVGQCRSFSLRMRFRSSPTENFNQVPFWMTKLPTAFPLSAREQCHAKLSAGTASGGPHVRPH